ncbi:MAG TPA: type II secretion system protein [Tepidisphaeraceae bacterium]|nr:type II secretion system protein [Tepidisphaeraceae bacterium]
MKRRAGFTLIELLFAVVLLMFFLNFAGSLFRQTINTSRQSQQWSGQMQTADAAIAKLRGDVWGAGKITTTADSAQLMQPDGSEIDWRLNGSGSLTRFDGHRRMAWNIGQNNWRFDADGATLTILAKNAWKPQQIPLVSQVLLGRENPS